MAGGGFVRWAGAAISATAVQLLAIWSGGVQLRHRGNCRRAPGAADARRAGAWRVPTVRDVVGCTGAGATTAGAPTLPVGCANAREAGAPTLPNVGGCTGAGATTAGAPTLPVGWANARERGGAAGDFPASFWLMGTGTKVVTSWA